MLDEHDLRRATGGQNGSACRVQRRKAPGPRFYTTWRTLPKLPRPRTRMSVNSSSRGGFTAGGAIGLTAILVGEMEGCARRAKPSA